MNGVFLSLQTWPSSLRRGRCGHHRNFCESAPLQNSLQVPPRALSCPRRRFIAPQASRVESLCRVRAALAEGPSKPGTRRLVVADDTMHLGSMRHECRQIARRGASRLVRTSCGGSSSAAAQTDSAFAQFLPLNRRTPPPLMLTTLSPQNGPRSLCCGSARRPQSRGAATPPARGPPASRTEAWTGYPPPSRPLIRGYGYNRTQGTRRRS